MSDISDAYKRIPFFTRYWLTLIACFTLVGRLGLISPYTLVLAYEPLKRFEIWRIFTSAFFYPLSPGTGFHFLMNLYFLYNYSKLLETGFFSGKPADYFTMLVFHWVCSVIVGLIVGLHIIMEPMILATLYVWCRLNKDVIVNFWFGTQFKAIYLPWVFLGFNMILNGGGLYELIGILIGHLYVFLMFQYPQELGGSQLLSTPSIFKQWFPDTIGGVHGFGTPPPRAPQPQARRGVFGRHNWGTGHVLGGN
ncbi:derlin-1 [Onthophagus taurus]|uniref:derlin-1 n=1 Tax=Onthophagus taurus TaxID=166361 RepID=UPI000C200378|nr:derlin-1 [Onthophagus taurus]